MKHAMHLHRRWGGMGSPPLTYWVCSCGRWWKPDQRQLALDHLTDNVVESARFPFEVTA